MKVLPQLYINGSEGFSEELLQIYGGGKTNDYQREKE